MEAALIAVVKAHPIALPDDFESLLAKLKYKRATIDNVPKAMAAHLMKQLSKVMKHHLQVQIRKQMTPVHQTKLDTYHAALKHQASSFFYIYEVSPNVFKIGLTGNLTQRQKTLQTYREKKVKLIGFVEHAPDVVLAIEQQWKKKLADWGLGCPGGTELFDLNPLLSHGPDTVQYFIAKVLDLSKTPREIQGASFGQVAGKSIDPPGSTDPEGFGKIIADMKKAHDKQVSKMESVVKKVRGEKRKADAEIKEQKRKDAKMTKAFHKSIKSVDEKKRLKDAGHENKLVNKMATELRKHCMVADKYKLTNNPEWCCVQDLINKAARSPNKRTSIARELLETKKGCKGANIYGIDSTSLNRSWQLRLYCRSEHFFHVLALISLRATKQAAKDELFSMVGWTSNINLSLSAVAKATNRVNKQNK
jgi:hypothetical protein